VFKVHRRQPDHPELLGRRRRGDGAQNGHDVEERWEEDHQVREEGAYRILGDEGEDVNTLLLIQQAHLISNTGILPIEVYYY
jgi:hypothetical protein